MTESVLPPGKTREFASVFDTLVQSNLSLTQSVGRLVRLSWAIIGLNLVLITSAVGVAVWVVAHGSR